MKTIGLIILVLILTFVIVKLIDKFVPQKNKWIFTTVFWLVTIFIGVQLYYSIMEPIHFKKEKEVRYAKVISKLKDIREAQIAHKTVTGAYNNDLHALVKFVDTAKFTLTQRRDTTIRDDEASARFGIDMYKDKVLIDTLGTEPVKDRIFKDTDRYKTMMNVPGTDIEFTAKTDKIEKGKTTLPVFEVSVAKDAILEDLPKHLVAVEKETIAVDGVNGDAISVGSLTEVTTNGNWPRKYDEEPKK